MTPDIHKNEKDAVLLLFLSLSDYRKSAEAEYTYNGITYKGTQTNDAPCRMLLHEAAKAGHPITHVFCITTRKVYTEDIGTGITQFQNFRNMLSSYARELPGHGSCPDIIPLFYGFNENALPDAAAFPLPASDSAQNEALSASVITDPDLNALHIYQAITQQLGTLRQPSVYIDYTGGTRDVSLLMTTVVRYMELSGASIRKIVYSNHNDKKIYDILYIYEMFRLINGSDNFITGGSARRLRDIFRSLHADKDESPDVIIIRDALDKLVHFSDSINLCTIQNILDDAQAMDQSLVKAAAIPVTSGDLYIRMFQTLIPQIRTKMYADQWANTNIYESLIKWTVENRLIQQAATLYADKMPVLYIDPNPDSKYYACMQAAGVAFTDTDPVNAFYGDLFDEIMLKENSVDAFRTILDSIRRSARSIRRSARGNPQEICSIVDRQLTSLKQQEEAACTEAERTSFQILREGLQRAKPYLIPENLIPEKKKRTLYFYDSELILPENSSVLTLLTLYNVNNPFLHYLLYNNEEAYNYTFVRKRDNKFRRKVEAIRVLEKQLKHLDHDGIPEEDARVQNLKKLIYIMRYYLAVKLIRNHMNHAIEDTQQSNPEILRDEEAAIQYLENAGIHVSMDVESIRKILLDGLNPPF